MPLFDFRCDACGHDFEAFTRAGSVPACPKCQAASGVSRRLSGFGIGASKTKEQDSGGYLGRGGGLAGMSCRPGCACH